MMPYTRISHMIAGVFVGITMMFVYRLVVPDLYHAVWASMGTAVLAVLLLLGLDAMLYVQGTTH